MRKLNLNEIWISEQSNEGKWPQLEKELSSAFLSKTRREWSEIFDGTDACVEPVLSWQEVEDHPQNKTRGTFFREKGILQAAAAPKFSRSSPCNNIATSSTRKTLTQVLKEWEIKEN